MNVCEAVTSLLIIKWLARSLAPLRLTDTRHPFHTRVSSPIRFKVARYIYLYTFVHTFPIISSFTYSLREFDATLVLSGIDDSLLLFPKLSMFPSF